MKSIVSRSYWINHSNGNKNEKNAIIERSGYKIQTNSLESVQENVEKFDMKFKVKLQGDSIS